MQGDLNTLTANTIKVPAPKISPPFELRGLASAKGDLLLIVAGKISRVMARIMVRAQCSCI